jgi:hypothetical protein
MCDGTEQFHTVIREGEAFVSGTVRPGAAHATLRSFKTNTHLTGNCLSCVTVFYNQFNQIQSTSTVMSTVPLLSCTHSLIAVRNSVTAQSEMTSSVGAVETLRRVDSVV